MTDFLRPELRFARAWFVAALLLLGFALSITLCPVPHKVLDFTLSDKLAHALAFMGFMVIFSGLVRSEYWRFVFVALLAYGGAIEVLQLGVPSRSAEWADLLADAVGLLAGLYIARRWLADWCLWLERRLPRP